MKKIKFTIFILILSPFLTLAQTNVFKFFEFSPLSSDNFLLNTNQISQIIIPFNDYLSIIGLYLENPEIADLKITLLNKYNDILFEKEFTLPVIEKSWWGREYLFPLNENLRIRSGEKYKLIVQGLMENKIRIFVKNILEILQGTETYLYFPESLGDFYLNNVTTTYSFKLSLYEGREELPPQLSNLKINILSPYEVKISFNANEPIKYEFFYRKNSEATSSSIIVDYFISCPSGIRDCEINLKTDADSAYLFEIKAQDFWNNISTLNGEFKTPKESIISNEEGSVVSGSLSQTISKEEQSISEKSLAPELSTQGWSRETVEKLDRTKTSKESQISLKYKTDISPDLSTSVLTTSLEKISDQKEVQKVSGTSTQFNYQMPSSGILPSIKLFFKNNFSKIILPAILILLVLFTGLLLIKLKK